MDFFPFLASEGKEGDDSGGVVGVASDQVCGGGGRCWLKKSTKLNKIEHKNNNKNRS